MSNINEENIRIAKTTYEELVRKHKNNASNTTHLRY